MGKPNGKDEKLGELKKGPWTREEDQKLLAYIEQNGHGSWRALPAKAGLQRCGKSCRLRWTNYLKPDIKRGKFSSQEEKAIIRLHALLGNRWSAIATHLPKRTDNEIKNYWNTRLKKRLTRMGIDPVTHKPKTSSGGSAQAAAVVSHMAQWETARLEAEARLARECKLLPYKLQLSQNVTPPPPPPQAAAIATPCLDVLKVWQATGARSSFFGSPGCLDSPTSTLNFSVNCTAAGAPSSWRMANDIVLGNSANSEWVEQPKGTMENSVQQIHHDHFITAVDYGCNNPPGSSSDDVDMNCQVYNNTTTDFEENKNYWNELLNLVSSPVESPAGF